MAREDQEREAGRKALAELDKDIKEKSFRRAYLFCGEEDYLRASYRSRLAAAVSGGDTMNVRNFEGKGVEADRVVAAGESLPFFADYMLVIVRDSGIFKKSADELVDFLDNVPDTTVMVFDEEAVDKRSRLYKKIASAGLVVPCPRQSEQSLRNWIAGGFAQFNKKITRGALERFSESVGDNMVYIRQEMDKLTAYVGDRAVIEEEDVAAVTSVRVQDRIFDMIDCIANGERPRAMRIYADMLELRTPPMVILYMLARHFLLLARVKEMSADNLTAAQIAAACKTQEWAVKKKYLPQARHFTAERLAEDLRLTAQTEQAIKSGELADKVAIEPLILQLMGVGRE